MFFSSRAGCALIAALALLAPLAGAASAQTDPVAVDDPPQPAGGFAYYQILRDQPGTIPGASLLQNDSDPDGDRITITGAGNGAHGTAVRSGSDIRYTPTPGFTGFDRFTYTISDPTGRTSTAFVYVGVVRSSSAGNLAPAANDDSYSMDQGGTLTISEPGVLANDTDANGDQPYAHLASGPANGTLRLDPFGSFTYTPNAGFSGTDSFQYFAGDGFVFGNVATVRITVRPGPPNAAPVANADSYAVNQGGTLTIDAPGVLANDTDAEGNPLTAVLVSNPSSGTATLNPDGSFTYTPNADFSGVDSFTYKANDGAGDSSAATVTITVRPAGGAPVANDDSFEIQGSMLTVDAPGVLANDTDPDGDPLTAVLVSEPANGTVTLNADGSFNYLPDAGFDGADSFTYKANDGAGDSNTATVTIRVPAVNNATDAVDDQVWLRPDRVFIEGIRPRDNDTGADGSRLTVTGFTPPASGRAQVFQNPNNTFDYLYLGDRAGFTGDSFTYTITDERGGEDTATVFITTENNPPVAVDDHAGVAPGRSSITIAVLGNDYDPDNRYNYLLIQGFTQPAHGTVALIGSPESVIPQRLVYTPNPGFTGFDEFTYTLLDGENGGTDTATVFIEPRNHAPVAVDDPAFSSFGYTVFSREFVFRDFPSTLFPTFNDFDLDDDPLTLGAVTPPAHGTVALSGPFSTDLRYTPEPGYLGPDEITYTLSDGRGGTDTAAIHLLVVNPSSQITTISPNSVARGGPAFTLTVNGFSGESSGRPLTFLPNSSVLFNNRFLETTYVSPTQLTAVVPASLITEARTVNVTVLNPILPDLSEGWWNSNSVPFTITEAPANRPPDARDDSGATTWDAGVDIAVTFNDSDPDGDTLTVTAATPGPNTNGTLTFNPLGFVRYTPTPGFTGTATFTYTLSDGRGGAATGTVSVAVSNPVPHLGSLSPGTAMTGGPAFTLTVNGTRFAAGSIVRWKGANRPTTYVSSTQLTADIPAADIAAAGAASVTVVSPAPGGGTSNPLVFTVGTPKLGVSVTFTRSGAEATATLTLRNTGGMTAANVRLNGATLLRGAASFSGGSLPLSFGDIAPGGSSTQTLSFNVGTTQGGSASLSLSGVYTGGTFGSTLRVTLP